MRNRTIVALVASSASLLVACGGAAAPFDKLSDSAVTVYRLQNYEPPAAVTSTGQQGALPGLPPQIDQFIRQSAQVLPQLIPPGLLPPGLLPGTAAQTTPQVAQAADTAPRFHGFRILGQTQVIDNNLKKQLAELLGNPDSFGPNHAPCMYAEMGLSFSSQPGATPNDVLISFSCNQLDSPTFPWPHPNKGMTPDSVQELSALVNKLWPPGT